MEPRWDIGKLNFGEGSGAMFLFLGTQTRAWCCRKQLVSHLDQSVAVDLYV